MNGAWLARLAESARAALSESEGMPLKEREKLLARACPFKRGSALFRAWWQAVAREKAGER